MPDTFFDATGDRANVQGRVLNGNYGILITLCCEDIGYVSSKIYVKNRICANCNTENLTDELMEVTYLKSYQDEYNNKNNKNKNKNNKIKLSHQLYIEIYCKVCYEKLLNYDESKWRSLFSLRKMQNKLKEPIY